MADPNKLKSNLLLQIWQAIYSKCLNINYTGYELYGGRGITLCDRWLDSANFIADMLPTFERGLVLERISDDGNFEPANCILVRP